MRRKKLFLVDGNAYCYRAYYAMTDLRASDGRPTGAVFGFLTMLNKLRAETAPDYLAVCFDLKGPTKRHEKFAEYKINRKPMPDELREQMGTIKEALRAYGIPIFEMAGYEADDIIATLAARFKTEMDVFVASSDKDMLQLIDKYVKIYHPQKDDAIIDEEKVLVRYNVKPSQITDLLALTGDSSDNIPGVPGIGEKTASELIRQFGDLETILRNTAVIPQKKRRELLQQYAEQARLSKDLATVMTDVPIPVSPDALEGKEEDSTALKKIFQTLEFKSLYSSLMPDQNIPAGTVVQEITGSDRMERFTDTAARAGELFLAVRGDEQDRRTLHSIDLCIAGEPAVRLERGRALAAPEIVRCLDTLLRNKSVVKTGYDLKTACIMLEQAGIYLDEPFFDCMVAAYLLEPGAGTPQISDIAALYAEPGIDIAAVEALRVFKPVLQVRLEDKNLTSLFSDVEMPLVRVLASMEEAGIHVDRAMLVHLGGEFDGKLTGLTDRIYASSGCEFNINSPKQLSDVLFNRLRLPVIKKGKSGPSTDGEVLERLSAKHALPKMILEYRELAKLKSTYVEGMLSLIDARTRRIHTSFNQAVTATGRLSSSEPNLQNIPVRTEAGRQIRAAFTSRGKGWQLLSADYSQIELRVLAHLSGDRTLIDAFRHDADIHALTASLVFNIDQNTVTDEMRDLAKRVNFGILYGMGPYGLARDLGIANAEAKRFIEEYFLRYPGVQAYMQRQVDEARSRGYVTTLLNRRRYIPQINAQNPMQRSFAERTAMNTPVQGTAADLIKAAMVAVHHALEKEGLQAQMVLQVHDELVFDVPDAEMAMVQTIVTENMEHVISLEVPVKVGIKTGVNWRDMH